MIIKKICSINFYLILVLTGLIALEDLEIDCLNMRLSDGFINEAVVILGAFR
jgi:hypothetical protein